ncbi:MAG: 3-deoxy-7-phosphoheptulonate synthase, partial [Phycisphaerales bacterium]|nr:3-deoxy-7-phosphoheptulonate synthase [Phycisphaerales bacterium]
MRPTSDLNVAQARQLVTPRQVKADLPINETSHNTVERGRDTIKQILSGSDTRLLVVVGPCSIHDPVAALDYARKLREIAIKVQDRIFIVMRVYFEKPRTTVGWKGLINDPHLDGSFDIETGLRRARKLLLEITGMCLPAGTEMLDPIVPQYIDDLVTWAAIGARTIESQTHREMASGLSMPVGYKNGTSGDLQIAIDAMLAARTQHSFLGIDTDGRTAIIQTRGNKHGHIILRGGKNGPNYDPDTLAKTCDALKTAKLCPGIMVDCSHANAAKKFQNQELVWRHVIEQRLAGNHALMGLLVESNLLEGHQPFPQPVEKLTYASPSPISASL